MDYEKKFVKITNNSSQSNKINACAKKKVGNFLEN